ncbi:hypothetical protein T484DRAFT_1936431 [Baffinella frigidus]|nr:hypothetical protein T484DRAFT_1936431 [Cryptophyta sp. CCMP2293]
MAPLPSSTSDQGGNVFDFFKQLSCGINFADVLSCDPHPAPAEAAAFPAKTVNMRPTEGFNKRSTDGHNSEGKPVGESRQAAKARAVARRQNLPVLDFPALTPGEPAPPPLPPTNASTAEQEQAHPVVSRSRSAERSAEQVPVSRTSSAEQAPQVSVSRTASAESGASGVERRGSGGGARLTTGAVVKVAQAAARLHHAVAHSGEFSRGSVPRSSGEFSRISSDGSNSSRDSSRERGSKKTGKSARFRVNMPATT